MEDDATRPSSEFSGIPQPAIRFLVESALKSLASECAEPKPGSRDEWVRHLSQALMSEAEVEHHKVLSSLMANGVSNQELLHFYIPEASRYLGEKWVSDEASFVDVTTGAARLQALFRDHDDDGDAGQLLDRSIPLGQSVLMIIPQFEQHSLGAFVAADGLRRHGLWVRMAIGLCDAEIARLISANRFSMLGISLASWKSVEKAADFIEDVRKSVADVPPIVVGGRIVEDREEVERRSGADFAVHSIREAIERCGLSTVAKMRPFEVAQ